MDEAAWLGILEQYGQQVLLCRGEEKRQIRAFFQPVRERKAGEEPTPLGVAPRGKYLYLGPMEESLEDVERLEWRGKGFYPLRRREVPVGDKIAYQWGIFEEIDGGGA